MIGQRFGKWVVLEQLPSRKTGKKIRSLFLCLCDCGNKREVLGTNLRLGTSMMCRTCAYHKTDERGNVYGRLLVLKEIPWNINIKYARWLCLCFCGKMTEVSKYELHSGNTKSCGCLKHENSRARVGDKHHNWNSNIDRSERLIRKNRYIIPSYRRWRNIIISRGYCDACQSNENLVAHHLNNFSEHKDLRTDINNGICLCTKCHIEFHKLYGKHHNSKEQYLKFKDTKNVCTTR